MNHNICDIESCLSLKMGQIVQKILHPEGPRPKGLEEARQGLRYLIGNQMWTHLEKRDHPEQCSGRLFIIQIRTDPADKVTDAPKSLVIFGTPRSP